MPKFRRYVFTTRNRTNDECNNRSNKLKFLVRWWGCSKNNNKKKKTGGSERDRGKKKKKKGKKIKKKKKKKKRWTTFKLNFKKSILPPYIRSRAVRPPSCVHFYVPFCRISAIRYTDIRHEQHRHATSTLRHAHSRTLPYLHTHDNRRRRKMMKTNCYALGYRVFKFYFQFTHSRMLGFS